MNETAYGPKSNQSPEAGHGGFEKNILPMFTESGSNEGASEQEK